MEEWLTTELQSTRICSGGSPANQRNIALHMLLIWFGLCILAGLWARSRGHNGFYLFLASFFFSPLIEAAQTACTAARSSRNL